MTLRDLIRGGFSSLGTTHPEIHRSVSEPRPVASFSAAAQLAHLFEGEAHPGPLSEALLEQDGDFRAALARLSGSQRASLEARFGVSVLEELVALSRCPTPRDLAEALLNLGIAQENQGRLEVANAFYQTVVGLGEGDAQSRGLVERAQMRLNAVLGTGAVLPRTEFLLRRLAAEATEPTSLVGMAAAGFAFRMTRMAVFSRLAASPSANFLTRGFGASALSSLIGFGVEAPTFTLAGRLANEEVGRSQDWSGRTLRRDLASSFLTLGGLRLMGWAAGAGFNRIHGINPLTGQATRLVGLSAVSQRLIPQLGMLGGIMLGHRLEERFGLREHHDGATTMVDSLAMLLQFHVAGALQAHAFGERVRSWEQGLDQQMELMERSTQIPPRSLGSLIRGLEGLGPQPALAAAGMLPAIERGNGTESENPLSGPQLVFNQALGDGSGVPASSSRGGTSRRIDPEQTLVVLPTGALTPHGTERSTYQRAMGSKEWYAEVGVMNGHLEYRGEGTFADKASGEVLNYDQIAERFGERIRGETGFRQLGSTLPIETPWGGQIPSGLRGEDGKIEGRLLEVMGLTPSQVKQLSFNQSTTLITKADQYALQGLYAMFRSGLRWGARLDEIVGDNPEGLGIATAPGLGGMNHLVHLFLASARRKAPDSTKTDPATLPLWLPSTLADSMQGVWVAVLGPKYENTSVGPNPVDVGACATGYKAFVQAADMFRPNWPGAAPVELALFGSSEAPHGHPHARPSATGFNAMGAMETLERLGKRLGLSQAEYHRALESLENHYAPMTDDVFGFWPSEGAGAGGLIRLHRAIELGLPFSSGVAGYAMRGDQGGKKNPADIGYGGRSALRTSLRMAEQWQGLNAADLDYFSGHLTGTPTNNAAEAALFAEVLPPETRMRLVALKAFLGHGLGAAGSMEIALVQAALENGVGPGAFNVEGRRLAQAFQELHPRVQVSSAPATGVRFAGGQSQGFAGNNAAALFRAIDDQVLHEVYGYSLPEIEAYRSRRSEREAVSRQWEEDILAGRRSIGEFLSWFGLGGRPPERPTTVVLPGAAGETSTVTSRTNPESGQAPAFLRGIGVRPDQMIVSLGRGSMLTTRGTGRATRAAAMRGVDAPLTLAYLAEDFALTRYAGRNEAGQETWVRGDNGEPITPDQIAIAYGERLLRESGIRDLPLEGDAQGLPVRHGGLLPEPLRGSSQLLQRMGLNSEALRGTSFGNQSRNLDYASDAGIMGLYVALTALGAFGRPLGEHFAPSRFGASQGSAFPGLERFIEMNDDARRGRDSVTYRLQSALPENGRGLLLNLLMPHFDFGELRQNPDAIARILPANLASGAMPNTGGVNLSTAAACASGLYALFNARMAMLRQGVPGEYPMDAMMVFGADATFSPYASAPAVAGFSRRAPMTVDSMVRKLVEQGRLEPEVAQLPQAQREALWNQLPEPLRRAAMSESSAPFTRYARGLVVAEGAAGIPWMNFQRSIEQGLWPSSRLLGIHVNSGEGGAANLASMDQGIVTATMVALRQADAHGGARPSLLQAHGTSTDLNNIAELQSLVAALRYVGTTAPIRLNAIKGLVGHSMGAASAIDMVMGVQTLLDGEAPGLFNFQAQDLDPRYAERAPEILQQFEFTSEPLRGGMESLLITSEGFLASDAAAVLGHFPQDPDVATDLLRDYGVPEHQRTEWRSRATENRARAEAWEEGLRRGRLSVRELLDQLRFR